MPASTTSEHSVSPVAPQAAFSFRCIACGHASEAAGQDFRCAHCGDLVEIIYPHWGESDKMLALQPDRLKSIWKQRRLSSTPADLSGVWRFRELLPALTREENIITLREGNTPLYELP